MFAYLIIKWLVRLFSPKMEVVGAENIPEGGALIVGNHCQMYGPIACELYFPGTHYTWCAKEMMFLKEVPAYAFRDFWSFKPKSVRWFYRILSFIVAPISVIVFNHANCIGVYRDIRIRDTFKATAEKFADGANVIIFPEENRHYNAILYDFQEGFSEAARMCARKTGRPVPFVPMYIAPALKKMVIGTPVWYDADAPAKEERKRIASYCKEEITRLAVSLPEHTVVPYRNIPKKLYPKNTDES